MGMEGCTAPPYFEMDYNELLNFEDYIDNVSQMGVQNEITHKALYPCFQIPNAPLPVF